MIETIIGFNIKIIIIHMFVHGFINLKMVVVALFAVGWEFDPSCDQGKS